nr:GIY-YIG nuclease family protein [Fulvivirga aurantia]
MLLKKNPGFIEYAIKRNSGETKLPPNLPKAEYEDLPELAGVYYFLDAHGEVIYVGKAKNIKKRITSHFSGTSKNRRNQYIRNEIHHIDYELTGNELVALLLESSEIKRLWPKYNRAQKFRANQWAIYLYEDRDGYLRFNISKFTKGLKPEAIFYSHADAWQFLLEKVKTFELCPKFCGIQKSNGPCFDFKYGQCLGACDHQESVEDYNNRLLEALATFNPKEKSFAIMGEGRHEEEQSVILIENGTYYGFGFLENDLSVSHIDELRNIVTPYKTTSEIDQYIQSHSNRPEVQVVEFD